MSAAEEGDVAVNTEVLAHAIYTVLVEEAGARESKIGRADFVYHVSRWLLEPGRAGQEYRFQGELGFGGKLWVDYRRAARALELTVNCYREDETATRRETIGRTNRRLAELVANLEVA